MTRLPSGRYLGAMALVANSQHVPLYVPLFFVAWGVFLAFLNREDFKDPDGALRRMAARRAQSRIVRLLSGSGDPEKEYRQLQGMRWLFPFTALVYGAFVLLLLVVAISQL
jgi:hypothetical protein